MNLGALKQTGEDLELFNSIGSALEYDLQTADLEQLSQIIHHANHAVSQHLLSAMQAALLAGRALIAAKELFGYDRNIGGFRGWLDRQNISRPTAYRYMKLAEHSEIVSNAATFTEAFRLIEEFSSISKNKKSSQSTVKKVRTTLTFKSDSYKKLVAIAERDGVKYSDVIEKCVNYWLENQKIDSMNMETKVMNVDSDNPGQGDT